VSALFYRVCETALIQGIDPVGQPRRGAVPAHAKLLRVL